MNNMAAWGCGGAFGSGADTCVHDTERGQHSGSPGRHARRGRNLGLDGPGGDGYASSVGVG
jgi:hypothetical protein